MSEKATAAVVNGRILLHSLAVVLESQQISVSLARIVINRDGLQTSVSLLDIVRAAQNSFDELEIEVRGIDAEFAIIGQESNLGDIAAAKDITKKL